MPLKAENQAFLKAYTHTDSERIISYILNYSFLNNLNFNTVISDKQNKVIASLSAVILCCNRPGGNR